MNEDYDRVLTIWEPSPWSTALGIGVSVVAGGLLLYAGILDQTESAVQLACVGSLLSVLFIAPRRLRVTSGRIEEAGLWRRAVYQIDQLVEADVSPSIKGQDHAFLRFEPSGALFVAMDGSNSRFGARVLSALEERGKDGICTERFRRWALR